MANTYKRLGAVAISTADTDTSLYTVPSATSAVVSSILVCNKGTSSATFRVAHVDGAISAVASEDYLYYDVDVPANDTFAATIGISMAAANSILVRSDSTDVNFILWGSEIT